MALGIRGKTALVTGAGRGIGRAISQALASEGARVIAVSRTQSDLDSLLDSINGPSAGHMAIARDLMDRRQTEALLAELSAQPSVDIVVHNLGGTLDITDPFCSAEDWRNVYRLNLEIPIELNLDLVPRMTARGWGRIVHISSISAFENQGPVSYCAMKAALAAYTRSFAGIVAKDGVIMTSVLPGAVMTEGGYWESAKATNPDHYNKYVQERMRIGRLGTPQEIASVVAFLCSEHVSFAVGSTMTVDGGQGRGFFS